MAPLLVASPAVAQAGVAATGQQASNARLAVPAATADMEPTATVLDDYVIGPDDVLSVVFWRDQQLSGDVLVRPDGKISIPLLDDVRAAGLTPKQLRDQVASEARRYVSEPIVTVVVKQINSRKVYITGQVVRPGQYPLTSSLTVLQLIATAGGLSDYAKSKDIRVVRVEAGRPVRLKFDYDEATKPKQKKTPDIELKSGDTVVVP
jgi:polysaccharide export outer membrane protein